MGVSVEARLEDPDARQQRYHRNDSDDLVDQILLAVRLEGNCNGGVHADCLFATRGDAFAG